ncbi:MAG: hypothetical protein N3A72_08050, partial [bacterium]|nr:hypothetical protein [bacterium]
DVYKRQELRFSKGKRYPAGFPSSALVIPASRCTTLTIDGNPSDWSSTTSIAIHCDFSASTTGGKLACDVKFAWDASYLYILVQETAGDTTQNEAANGSLYSAAPWAFDGISFWIDLDNNNDNRTSPSIGDFNPWFGFSSLGRNDLYIARVNNDAGLVLAPFANGTVATGGSFTSHNRVIEARLSWSDIVSSVDTARQPGGNLLSAISIGFKFGCEPLLIDDNYTKQTFIGGSQYTPPTGADMNSRDIQLVHDSTMEPTFAIHWELYE